MLKAAKSRFYLVPVLMHTLDILEFLSTPDARLKLNEISDATGVPDHYLQNSTNLDLQGISRA